MWTTQDQQMQETHIVFRTDGLEDLSADVRVSLSLCFRSNHETLNFFNNLAPNAELINDTSQCHFTFRYSSVSNFTEQRVWDWVRRVAELLGPECGYYSESDWTAAVMTTADNNMHIAVADIIPSNRNPIEDGNIQEVETHPFAQDIIRRILQQLGLSQSGHTRRAAQRQPSAAAARSST